MTTENPYRSLPQVGVLLERESIKALIERHGRSNITAAIKRAVENARLNIKSGGDAPPDKAWPDLVAAELQRRLAPNLVPVLNATGVVIHTNLGRSRLAPEAADAVRQTSVGYSTLEYDLELGERGSRHDLVRELLIEATGAQEAFAVNNNAGAVLLVLAALAKDRKVPISRGQLVEIGGSFRIPEIMSASGAIMVEVGTTNKTHIKDYEAALDDDVALIMRAHPSNYRIVGFSEDVSRAVLVELARKHSLPVIEDLGSGCLVDLSPYGLTEEPTASKVLADGVDIVTFSGDKLLGGPQSGIIAGNAELVLKCRQHPMARALRLDKMTLAALEATLRLTLDADRAVQNVPTLRALTLDRKELAKRAKRLARVLRTGLGELAAVGISKEVSRAGGGALPLIEIPTKVVTVAPRDVSVDDLALRLRRGKPPLIARISQDRLLLDPRTLEPDEIGPAAHAVLNAIQTGA